MSKTDHIDTIVAAQYDATATPPLPFGENNSSVRALDADRAMTQRGLVFTAMLNGEQINGEEARRRWGCRRLAARIGELRKQGYRIVGDIGEDRCAVYWLPKDEIERINEECK